MAGRKDIILHKPECIVSKAATHDSMSVLFYKLTEIIGVDDVRLYAGGRMSSRPKPTAAPVPSARPNRG